MAGINIIGQKRKTVGEIPDYLRDGTREQDSFEIPEFEMHTDPSDHIAALEEAVRNMELEEQKAVARGLDPVVMLQEIISTVTMQHNKLTKIEAALSISEDGRKE